MVCALRTDFEISGVYHNRSVGRGHAPAGAGTAVFVIIYSLFTVPYSLFIKSKKACRRQVFGNTIRDAKVQKRGCLTNAVRQPKK